jgi:hypothetical protein
LPATGFRSSPRQEAHTELGAKAARSFENHRLTNEYRNPETASGRKLPQYAARKKVRQLLDCGSPLPLFPEPGFVGIMPHLFQVLSSP